MPTDSSAPDRPAVLVVDDECGLADLYAVWLNETCDTRVAYDGRSALDELDDSIDVVFLDRRMPTFCGDDVAAEIRDRDLDCMICLVTAVDAGFDLLQVDTDDYLEKPVSQAKLQTVAARLYARTQLPKRFWTPLADLTKLVAIEASNPTCVSDDAYARVHRRTARQLTELDAVGSDIDRTTLATAIREPDEHSTVAGTVTEFRDQFARLGQVDR